LKRVVSARGTNVTILTELVESDPSLLRQISCKERRGGRRKTEKGVGRNITADLNCRYELTLKI
jgi:hypothetical protein